MTARLKPATRAVRLLRRYPGRSYASIARECRLTRERVRQLAVGSKLERGSRSPIG